MRNKLETIHDTLSVPELLAILGTQILLLTPHSQEFVDKEIALVSKLDIRPEVKDICYEILNEIKITEK